MDTYCLCLHFVTSLQGMWVDALGMEAIFTPDTAKGQWSMVSGQKRHLTCEISSLVTNSSEEWSTDKK